MLKLNGINIQNKINQSKQGAFNTEAPLLKLIFDFVIRNAKIMQIMN